MGKDIYASSRTEDDEASVDPVGGGLGQEVLQPLPAFLSGPLHVNFDSVTGAQRRPESSDSCIRGVVERCRKGDGIPGRRDRGDRPAVQVERNRNGQDIDASFRCLRFEPTTRQSIRKTRWKKKRKKKMVVTEARTNPSSSVSLAFTTTAPARPARAPLVCSFHSRIEPRTLASTTRSGWTVLGLGGRGKLSEMPVLGALKAERGKVGRDLGPFLRAPTPGEMGRLGRLAIKVEVVAGVIALDLTYPFDSNTFEISHVLRL
jgi:hypothetical protein